MQGRLAHLGDPVTYRSAMLGVEPKMQAQRALHFPLGSAGDMGGRELV